MPEVSVFLSEDDLELIVSELLMAGCVLVPDVLSERPEAYEINSLEDFRAWRSDRKERLFFTVSSDWKVAPFEWGNTEKNGKVLFFIRQKAGGPTLDIVAPFPFEAANAKTVLPHGSIAYHPIFWNPLTGRNERPPAALKAMHRRIVKRLEIEGDQLQGQHRRYLVAKGAKAKIAAGYVLGPPFDSR